MLVMMAVLAIESDATTMIGVHKFACCAGGVLPMRWSSQTRAGWVPITMQFSIRIAPNCCVHPYVFAGTLFPVIGFGHNLTLSRSLHGLSGGGSLTGRGPCELCKRLS